MSRKTKQIQYVWLLTAAALALVLTPACQRDKESKSKDEGEAQKMASGAGDPSAPVAKIGDRVITLGEFQKRINRQSPYVRGRYTSLEHKKEFLKNMIRFEVLALEAKKRGFDKDPDAIHAMKQVMVQRLMKEQFEKAMNPEEIPENKLREYYEKNKNLYNKPEEVRVSAIIMTNAAAAKKVATSAKSAEGSTAKGFRALVAKHSTDEATRLAGGDLRYFSKANKTIPKAVVNAAFALTKTSEVAGPIRAGGKYYIIRQTGRRLKVTKPFEKVADQIRDRVYREERRSAQKKFINKLRKGTKVEVFEKRLKEVKIDRKTSASHSGHDRGVPKNPPTPAMPAAQ